MQSGTIDVEGVSQFRAIPVKVQTGQAHDRAVKGRELLQQVHAASFQEAEHKLASDVEALTQYYARLKKEANRWADEEVVKKRKR